MSKKPSLKKDNVVEIFHNKYLKLYDLQYDGTMHYYDASRRERDDLIALADDEKRRNLKPDAVSCFIIIAEEGKEEKLLLQKEFRYPIGQEMLGITAGLMDKDDKDVFETAKREIREETGLVAAKLFEINHLVYSTPGMTDENNALIGAIVTDTSTLTNNNEEETEVISDYVMVNKQQADEILRSGKDHNGYYYPMFTWAALMYFLSDRWKEELEK